MLKVLISGAKGKMGQNVYSCISLDSDLTAVCGIDMVSDLSNANFPIYDNFSEVKEEVDVIIDFSSTKNLDKLLDFAIKTKTPAVLCVTGYTEEQKVQIANASKKVALFRSANMSLGVNVLVELVKSAAKSLYGFDVEIIEKHHNQKIDAPSGTAIMLADGVLDVDKEKFCVYGREGVTGKRDKNEIGIHAIRGGNIVGEHQVIFAGNDETITLTHQATDRKVFAFGALKAAKFMCGKKNGLYDMKDVLFGENV